MVKCYKGDVGTEIQVDCGTDITGAASCKLLIRKPDRSVVEWPAEVYEAQYLRYIVEEGDFDQAGIYLLQAIIGLNSWTGSGKTTTFTIYEKFK